MHWRPSLTCAHRQAHAHTHNTHTHTGDWSNGACSLGHGRRTFVGDSRFFSGLRLCGSRVRGGKDDGSFAQAAARVTAGVKPEDNIGEATYTGEMSVTERVAGRGAAGVEGWTFEFHRKGRCIFDDGSRYDGEWRNSQPYGRGALVLNDGTHFSGNVAEGEAVDGLGKLVYHCGVTAAGRQVTYEGGIVRGRRHGRGVLMDSGEGLRYEGEFAQDRCHGHGKMEVLGVLGGADVGCGYVGEWLSDRRCGHGVMTWPDASEYEGGWVLDQPQGKGRCRFADASIFEGDFGVDAEQGKPLASDAPATASTQASGHSHTRLRILSCTPIPSGRGRLEWPWGDVYVGAVKRGKPEGLGKLTCDNGDWKDGFFAGGGAEKGTSRSAYICCANYCAPASVGLLAQTRVRARLRTPTPTLARARVHARTHPQM